MALIRVEGRAFHHAAHSLLRFACARQRLVGGTRGCGPRRWYPHDVLVLPDGSESGFRSLRSPVPAPSSCGRPTSGMAPQGGATAASGGRGVAAPL